MPIVKIISEKKKYRVKKSRSLKNRDDRVHQLNRIWLMNSRKEIVPAQEKKILKIK
jgi:hypothetical protein